MSFNCKNVRIIYSSVSGLSSVNIKLETQENLYVINAINIKRDIP